LATEWLWVVLLLALAQFWWDFWVRRITIHGG
jgi:hypothetical protein